jgi:phosphohistidine phosphatase SixA
MYRAGRVDEFPCAGPGARARLRGRAGPRDLGRHSRPPVRPPHDVLEDLYLAEPGTLLAHIEALPDTATKAAVVAHNPGIEVLARMLAGPGPDADAMRAMTRGFPTAGIAVFNVNAESWEQVTAVETRLTAFAPPTPRVT